jgi:hypothetical protein
MDKPIKDIVMRDVRRATGSLLQRLETVMNSYAYIACNYISAGMFEKAKYYVKLFYYARSMYLKELDKEIENLEIQLLTAEKIDKKIKEEVKTWHS